MSKSFVGAKMGKSAPFRVRGRNLHDGRGLFRGDILLCDFIEMLAADYRERGLSGHRHLLTVRGNLLKFAPRIKVDEVDVSFCTGYSRWLRFGYVSRFGHRLAPHTVFHYFWQLGVILHHAERKGYIWSNPWRQLGRGEKIREPESKRRGLSLAELRLLEQTPYERTEIRDSFLFSCYSGLRISDIRRLRHADIGKVGERWCVSIVMRKNGKPLTVPLPERALCRIPRRRRGSPLVFGSLPSASRMGVHLKRWAALAGLEGKISFHVARHTYASLLVEAGADLYTTSRILGHTRLSTTCVYARVSDKLKREACGKMDRYLGVRN